MQESSPDLPCRPMESSIRGSAPLEKVNAAMTLFRNELRAEAQLSKAAEDLFEDANWVDPTPSGPPKSTRFASPISFFFGGKRFLPLTDCIVFQTTRYEWCIQNQQGGMVYARELRTAERSFRLED